MIRRFAVLLVLLGIVSVLSSPGICQTSTELDSYFKQATGLNQDQINDFRKGKPVVKVIKSRTPDDIIVFGAVHINATPESYARFFMDFDRLRTLPTYLAVGKFTTPPAVNDLNGFSFEAEDVKQLNSCSPADCKVQLPAKSMEA